MALPAWVNPPNFLAAITAGTEAGSRFRAQDIEQRNAADRLALAYNQLALEEADRNEQAQRRMEMAEAANALRSRQLSMLENWHQNQAAAAQRRSDIMEQYRTGQLALGNRKLDQPTIAHHSGEVLRINPQTGQVEVMREAPSSKREPMASIPLDPNNPFGPKMTGPISDPRIQSAMQALQAPKAAPSASSVSPLQRLKSLIGLGDDSGAGTVLSVSPIGAMPPDAGPGITPATAAAPAAPGAPFREGQVIRNKKDGKLYRVTNGQPVEMEMPTANEQESNSPMDTSDEDEENSDLM
jgi:hypothetical protein